MGLSHFLLLPLLRGDKTLRLGCGERSSNRLRGAGPGEQGGLQAHPPSSDLRFPSFLSSLTFPSSLLSPHPPYQSLFPSCYPDALRVRGLLARWRGRGCHLFPAHPAPSQQGSWYLWAPDHCLLPSTCGLLLGRRLQGPGQQGGRGCSPPSSGSLGRVGRSHRHEAEEVADNPSVLEGNGREGAAEVG